MSLYSPYDREVFAAARAINRVLASSGHDWFWFADRIDGGAGPVNWEAKVREAYDLGRKSARRDVGRKDIGAVDAFEDCQAAAQWLLDTHSPRLSERDIDFLYTMANWSGWPTEKQAAWLNSLCRRFGYRP